MSNSPPPQHSEDQPAAGQEGGHSVQSAQQNAAGHTPEELQAEKADRRKKIVILGTLAVVSVLIVVYLILHRGQVETDDAYTHGRIVSVAPHVNGYVEAMNINDNQFVHKGDLLVRLDGRDYLAELANAQASVQKALADLDAYELEVLVAKKTFPGQLVTAQGDLKSARGRLYRARTDYARQKRVVRAATSQQNIDQARAALDDAEGALLAAQGNLTQAEPVQAQIRHAQAQFSQAQAELAAAKASLERARLNADWTQILAPADGWISQRHIEHGDYVAAGQEMFSIVPPEVWIVANYKETQITNIWPGQKVKIHIDAYPDMKLKGHIDSQQMGTGESFSTFPPENATGNYVKTVQRIPIKIIIDSGLDPKRPLALGLSVETTTDTLKGRGEGVSPLLQHSASAALR